MLTTLDTRRASRQLNQFCWFVFDLTDEKSFTRACELVCAHVWTMPSSLVCLLIGNKADLRE